MTTDRPGKLHAEVRVVPSVEQFVEAASPRLVRTLAITTGDESLAHDVAQEALARAWQRWDKVSRMDSPEAWCYRVALNLATSPFRRRSSESRAKQRLATARPAVYELPDNDPALLDAMSRLPLWQRRVLALRFLADLSVEETAHALGVATGTVKSSTSRALAALRHELAKENIDATT